MAGTAFRQWGSSSYLWKAGWGGLGIKFSDYIAMMKKSLLGQWGDLEPKPHTIGAMHLVGMACISSPARLSHSLGAAWGSVALVCNSGRPIRRTAEVICQLCSPQQEIWAVHFHGYFIISPHQTHTNRRSYLVSSITNFKDTRNQKAQGKQGEMWELWHSFSCPFLQH